MKNQHLSDVQIQDWLDGNLSENSTVAAHLKDCPHCQAELATYQELIAALEQPIDFSLSAEFAAKMTQQIQAGDYRFSSRWWSWILIAGGFLLGIAINVYYLGAEKILTGFNLVKAQFVTFALSFKVIREAAVSLNLNHSLVFVAVLVLVCIYLLDRFVFQHRKSFQ